jgi:hypothetical protein
VSGSGSYIYATSTTTNIMSVLTQTSLDASTALAQKRFTLVQTLLQNQFAAKAAALAAQSKLTTGSEQFLQVEVSYLAQQKSTFSTLQNTYGGNVPLLGDLSSQLTALQNAVQAGDSAAFDGALTNATADVSYLGVAAANPAMQEDGVTALKVNGLGIKSSGNYDLTTAAGQSAAIADISAAQLVVSQIGTMTGVNQAIAGAQVTALGSRHDSLNNQLQNDQFASQAQAATDTLKLKTQLTTQLHLVELQFSNSQAAAKSLENQQNNLQSVLAAPAPGTTLSIFA